MANPPHAVDEGPASPPSGEVRLKCVTWSQVQALCTDVDKEGSVAVPLSIESGYVQLVVELPDGTTVKLRGHLSGNLFDGDGAPVGLLVQPRPTYDMRVELEQARQRSALPRADSERMAALAEEVGWTPGTSGISPRRRGDPGQDSHSSTSDADDTLKSQRPTDPSPSRKG